MLAIAMNRKRERRLAAIALFCGALVQAACSRADEAPTSSAGKHDENSHSARELDRSVPAASRPQPTQLPRAQAKPDGLTLDVRCPDTMSEIEAYLPIRCVVRLKNNSNVPILLSRDLRFFEADEEASTLTRSVRDGRGKTPPTRRVRDMDPPGIGEASFGSLQPGSQVAARIDLIYDYAPLLADEYSIEVAYVSRKPSSPSAVDRLRSRGAWFGALAAEEVRLVVKPGQQVPDEPIGVRCQREWREMLALGLDAPSWADLSVEQKFDEQLSCVERVCELISWHARQLVGADFEDNVDEALPGTAKACRSRLLSEPTMRCFLQAADIRAFRACAPPP